MPKQERKWCIITDERGNIVAMGEFTIYRIQQYEEHGYCVMEYDPNDEEFGIS